MFATNCSLTNRQLTNPNHSNITPLPISSNHRPFSLYPVRTPHLSPKVPLGSSTSGTPSSTNHPPLHQYQIILITRTPFRPPLKFNPPDTRPRQPCPWPASKNHPSPPPARCWRQHRQHPPTNQSRNDTLKPRHPLHKPRSPRLDPQHCPPPPSLLRRRLGKDAEIIHHRVRLADPGTR